MKIKVTEYHKFLLRLGHTSKSEGEGKGNCNNDRGKNQGQKSRLNGHHRMKVRQYLNHDSLLWVNLYEKQTRRRSEGGRTCFYGGEIKCLLVWRVDVDIDDLK